GRGSEARGPSRTGITQALHWGNEKNRISARAAGFGRPTSTDARRRSALGRANRALDGASSRRSARTNRPRHFRNAQRDSSLQTLRLFHHQRALRYLFGFFARDRVTLHSRTTD